MKIIVTGATGMVGAEVVRQAIADNEIEEVTLLVRNPSEIKHQKIREIVHKDFLHYDGLENIFRNNDACIWCLGISQSRVSKKDYFTITYEYAVEAAKAMLKANPSITFVFLSGEGADSSEKSSVRFAKVKGQTENELRRMNFTRLFIFRPGGIVPTHRSSNEGWYKKVEIFIVKMMQIIVPAAVVSTEVLAKAMLKTIKEGSTEIIIGHRAIRKL